MDPNIPTPTTTPPPQQPQGAEPNAAQTLATKTTPTSPLTIIRTMKSDAAETIKAQHETLVSMAIAEEKKKEAEQAEAAAKKTSATMAPEKPAPKPLARIVIILWLILFVAAAGVVIKFALPTLRTLSISNISLPVFKIPAIKEEGSLPSSVQTLAPSLIPAQSEKRFIVNKETPEHLFAMIDVERTAGATPASIRNLYFTEEVTTSAGTAEATPISANRLLLFADIPAPAILTRSLETPFMAGLYGEEDSRATPFFVFTVSSHDTGFAGMLAWEKDLPKLFDTMFGTKFLTAPSVSLKFHDIIIAGYDARVLEEASAGNIAYAFADPTTIIIAGDQNTLRMLISRFLVSSITK
ncbi:MAG: hypothetical protein ACYCZ7_01285 [Minisyncoccota bacterium]